MPARQPSPISWFTGVGNKSIADAAQGCQAMPNPSTTTLPSQKVSPDRKQILATSIGLKPYSV